MREGAAGTVGFLFNHSNNPRISISMTLGFLSPLVSLSESHPSAPDPDLCIPQLLAGAGEACGHSDAAGWPLKDTQ